MSNAFDPDDIVFGGGDGTACEQFVRAVRRRAFARDKQEDFKWIAHFAATCLAGEALRWHSALDDGVQTNWKLLEQALLLRYPASASPATVIQPSRPNTIPTPAAAPPTSSSLSETAAAAGPVRRIRILSTTQNASDRYLSKKVDDWGTFLVTSSVSDALRIQVVYIDTSVKLKLLNAQDSLSWLGLVRKQDNGPKARSVAYTMACTVNGTTSLTSKANGWKGTPRYSAWTVDPRKGLYAVWKEGEDSRTALQGAVMLDGTLGFLADDPNEVTLMLEDV